MSFVNHISTLGYIVAVSPFAYAYGVWTHFKRKCKRNGSVKGRISTGRTDCTFGPIYHATVADAEAWIVERELVDPEGVLRGDYYIDIATVDR